MPNQITNAIPASRKYQRAWCSASIAFMADCVAAPLIPKSSAASSRATWILVYPEAQDGCEDEPEGDEPEEEPVREPAGEQPGGCKSFTFERCGQQRGTGKVLARPVTRTTRAFQRFDRPRLRRRLGGSGAFRLRLHPG